MFDESTKYSAGSNLPSGDAGKKMEGQSWVAAKSSRRVFGHQWNWPRLDWDLAAPTAVTKPPTDTQIASVTSAVEATRK
jgi:hypothetical protein